MTPPFQPRRLADMLVARGLASPAQAAAAAVVACGVCSECMSCTFACGVNAINHEMVARRETVHVGAVILTPGYQTYRAELSEEFGYGRYANVITALQFERLLSASGPTMGHVQRPSDGKAPKKISLPAVYRKPRQKP